MTMMPKTPQHAAPLQGAETMESGKDKGRKITPEAADRRRRALELRRAGATYDEIATAMGLSGSGAAYRIVSQALKATYREPADDVRKLELERIDRLTRTLWPRAEAGEYEAVDRLLRLMDRRAKLLGLDAPTKTQADVNRMGTPYAHAPITVIEVPAMPAEAGGA